MSEERTNSLIRRIISNDYALVITIIGAVMAFVMTVVVPIQRMQLQIATLQQQITTELSDYKQIQTDHAVLKTQVEEITVRQTRMDNQIEVLRTKLK